MALVLGWLGRTGPIGWKIAVVANMVLRNLGLSVFIGAVAIGAGAPFVQTVATNGIQILLGGAPYCWFWSAPFDRRLVVADTVR